MLRVRTQPGYATRLEPYAAPVKPLGDSKPFQGRDERRKERSVGGQSLHHMLALDGPKGPQKEAQTPVLAALQHHKVLCGTHGAEEAKRSCVLVPETSNV